MEADACPPEVAAALRQQWPAHGLPLPASAMLTGFIAGAYQASLLREEDRPVQCHLLLRPAAPPSQLPPPPAATATYQLFAFSEPRPYSAQELRRLSSTTRRPGTLLAVEAAPAGDLVIRGLVFATRP